MCSNSLKKYMVYNIQTVLCPYTLLCCVILKNLYISVLRRNIYKKNNGLHIEFGKGTYLYYLNLLTFFYIERVTKIEFKYLDKNN
jgi:hypothetical protein